MRSIRLDRHFDLIVQLFSSFGYFETDEEDRTVLSNVSAMLAPDGWYVLDLINPTWLRKHFMPRTEKTTGTLTILEERTLTEEKVVKKLTLKDSASRQQHTFTESMRLFTLNKIGELLTKEGFVMERVIGNYLGEAFDEQASPRMMLFCRKSP